MNMTAEDVAAIREQMTTLRKERDDAIAKLKWFKENWRGQGQQGVVNTAAETDRTKWENDRLRRKVAKLEKRLAKVTP